MSALLDCPRAGHLQAFLGAALPPEQRQEYEFHLESCAACQERLDRSDECRDELLHLARQVGDPTATPPEPALTGVLEQLHETRSPVCAGPGEAAELYFLRPSDRPGLLGRLGQYELQEIIGQGGMGVVLRGFDPSLHRLVAIKVLAAAVAGSATARRRFTREAQACAAVAHDHVVAVHGVHEADGLPYLVMQYVPGESLQTRLSRTGPLEILEVVRIAMQAASGLAAAHAQGLIHRDIKPANLLLENGLARVKITDFGLARMIDDVRLTQSGMIAGTPEYMAPEQAGGEPVDHRADLFSLGSVMYAMCTGRPPFRGTTALAVLRQVSEREPEPVRSLNPDVPAWMEVVIARLMAKSPVERFQSAAEVAVLLEAYLAHLRQPTAVPAPQLPAQPQAAAPAGRRRSLSFRLAWLASLAAAVVLAALGWMMRGALTGGGKIDAANAVQDYHQRFDDRPESYQGLRLFGPDAGQQVRFEPEGMRITLPPGHRGSSPYTGMVTEFGVRGDFELTLGFEVLVENGDPRNPSKLTGLSLAVVPQRSQELDHEVWQKPSQNMASLYRCASPLNGSINLAAPPNGIGRMRQDQLDVELVPPGAAVPQAVPRIPNRNSMFVADSSRWDGDAGKDEPSTRHQVPAQAPSGHLRLVRTGPLLSYYVAEGSAEEFTLLAQDPFEQTDIRQVRIAGMTADARAELDVRVTELRIHADALPRAVAPVAARASRTWLLLFVPVALAPALVLWLYGRRRYARSRPETASPPLTFTCEKCSKKLKVRADSAGKRVRCPLCGHEGVVPVAAAAPGKPEEPGPDAEGIRR
jgi:hypothetical protein